MMIHRIMVLLLSILIVSAAASQATTTESPEAVNWIPEWVPCDFNLEVGGRPTCVDCSSVIKCTPVGGILFNCQNTPAKYCLNGLCSVAPSPECADAETMYSNEELYPM